MINKKIIFVILPVFLLTACNGKINLDFIKNKPAPQAINQQVALDDVLKGKKLVALTNQDKLYLVDPEFAQPVLIYTFKNKEKPNNPSFENFYLSPSHQWLVWYSANEGVIALNIKANQSKIIYKSSLFLNTNPFFNFHQNLDIIRFITDDGGILRQINLNDNQEQLINIPYPYGNVFKIDPNEKAILFVSGYGQSQKKAKFMFTDINGNSARQFTSDTNIADRDLVVWAPDSSGVIMPYENKLLFYNFINPEQPEIIYQTKNSSDRITNLVIQDGLIFALNSNGYWHVYDFNQKKEVARTPTSIASDLNKPYFLPWHKDQFLIEEVLEDKGIQFNRLWLSDFKGNKKIIVAKYNETIINTKIDSVQ
jgi:hypothetical protein